jgi:hypothetical protein
MTVPQTVPGQHLSAGVPAQTPSSGFSKQAWGRATHLPSLQSSPAQQPMVVLQVCPRGMHAGTARHANVLPSSEDTHSLPWQHAVLGSVQSWPVSRQLATHCPPAQVGLAPVQACSSIHTAAWLQAWVVSWPQRRLPGVHSPVQVPALHR